MKRNRLTSYIILLTSVLVASCSMTKDIPEGDQLFTGLKTIQWVDAEQSDNLIETQEELEAALATAPNGSLFGSSYYRLPFSFGVSVWNKYAEKDTPFARWMTKTFGRQPVLMSWVNPELRASVAQNVLRNHGYFHGNVTHEAIQQKNPKTAKIQYMMRPRSILAILSWCLVLMVSVSVSVPYYVTMATTITNLPMPAISQIPLSLTVRRSCSSVWPRMCPLLPLIRGISVASR